MFGPVWDRWNAMAPNEQVRQSTEANGALVTRFEVEPVDVVTTGPSRSFALDVGDEVTLPPSAAAGPDPLVLPAEALIRLVHGRLDPGHTPAGVDDRRLAGLRTAFPGC